MSVADDVRNFEESARRLVDVVFTDDTAYFDALPSVIDQELGTPLGGLTAAIEEGRSLADVRVAATLVVEVAEDFRAQMPEDLALLIDDLSAALRRLG
ncbi:hypothetical protein ACFRMQ_14270 [Kitasatospora sp. NPDC056783]|uniref:hypothetical protein n=1 Tax=Kitasatospora sp. NPDC056783 TaxID=3345943 RepID=UPI0036B8D165